jgi:glycosyltransferase involved in cell wall biosynthesis
VRLLLLNQYYPPDPAPTGQVLHDLARALIERGHDVSVVCSRRSYSGAERYPARQELDGVHVLRVASPGRGCGSALMRLFSYAVFYSALAWRLTWLPRPDVILSLTSPPYVGLIGAVAARLKRARTAHWIMDLYRSEERRVGKECRRLCRSRWSPYH